MKPEQLFSFRWHPHAVEPGMYDSSDPTTLVEFKLTKTTQGVLLTVTESGFDNIPVEHRAKAFQANEGGWSLMIKVIEEYLACRERANLIHFAGMASVVDQHDGFCAGRNFAFDVAHVDHRLDRRRLCPACYAQYSAHSKSQRYGAARQARDPTHPPLPQTFLAA
jgi:hypothetical protein